MQIIAINNTDHEILISSLGFILGIGESCDLLESFSIVQIFGNPEIEDLVNTSQIIISDGTQNLTSDEAILHISIANQSVTEENKITAIDENNNQICSHVQQISVNQPLELVSDSTNSVVIKSSLLNHCNKSIALTQLLSISNINTRRYVSLKWKKIEHIDDIYYFDDTKPDEIKFLYPGRYNISASIVCTAGFVDMLTISASAFVNDLIIPYSKQYQYLLGRMRPGPPRMGWTSFQSINLNFQCNIEENDVMTIRLHQEGRNGRAFAIHGYFSSSFLR